jgi:hypothetical protein
VCCARSSRARSTEASKSAAVGIGLRLRARLGVPALIAKAGACPSSTPRMTSPLHIRICRVEGGYARPDLRDPRLADERASASATGNLQDMRTWWIRASDLLRRWRMTRDRQRQIKSARRDKRQAEELQRVRDGNNLRGF